MDYYLVETDEVWVVIMPKLREWLKSQDIKGVVFHDGAKGYLLKFVELEMNNIAVRYK